MMMPIARPDLEKNSIRVTGTHLRQMITDYGAEIPLRATELEIACMAVELLNWRRKAGQP